MRARLLGAAVAGVLLLSAATPASAEETAWTQFQGGPSRSGFAAQAPVPPYHQAWPSSFRVAPELNLGLSAPVIAGNVAIAVGPRAVYGVNLATGQQAWKIDRTFGPSVPAAVATDPKGRQVLVYTEGFGDNPRPVVDAAASATAAGTSGSQTPSPSPSAPPSPGAPAPATTFTDEQQPRIVAVDLATREPIWDQPFDLEEVSRTGVTIDGGTIFVGDNLGNVYAVSLETGKALWSETPTVPGTLTSALAASDGTVVAAAQARNDPNASSSTERPHSAIVAFDEATGADKWTYTLGSAAFPTTSPSIGDGHVYIGEFDGEAIAIDLATGTEAWVERMSGIFLPTSSAVSASGAVYFVDAQYGHIFRLDPGTGAKVWDFALNQGVVRGVPVLAGSYLLITTASGQLAVIDSETGHLAYRGGPVGGLLGPVAVAGDVVVAVRGGKNAGLIAFTADPDGTVLDVASPTTLNPARLLSGFAIALVVLTLSLVLAARALLARLGPPVFEAEDDYDEDEDEDGA